MAQLTSDEWPADDEPTTTEREVPTSDAEAAAVSEFRAHGRPRSRAPQGEEPHEAGEKDEAKVVEHLERQVDHK